MWTGWWGRGGATGEPGHGGWSCPGRGGTGWRLPGSCSLPCPWLVDAQDLHFPEANICWDHLWVSLAWDEDTCMAPCGSSWSPGSAWGSEGLR